MKRVIKQDRTRRMCHAATTLACAAWLLMAPATAFAQNDAPAPPEEHFAAPPSSATPSDDGIAPPPPPPPPLPPSRDDSNNPPQPPARPQRFERGDRPHPNYPSDAPRHHDDVHAPHGDDAEFPPMSPDGEKGDGPRRHGLGGPGMPPPPPEFEDFDTNGDGSISRAEFDDMLARRPHRPMHDRRPDRERPGGKIDQHGHEGDMPRRPVSPDRP
ncbi:MAG: EF-hand domain-containing protein [Candidatus Hydrogenedentes bacterium]|nr:EF-hand domain-containing protein [Candidatus Hydrogenedentota bacterium]